MVHPVEWGTRARSWVADPISSLCVASGRIWAPRDAGGDNVFTTYVGDVIAHPQLRKAFPFVALGVPQVLDSGAIGACECIALSQAVDS